MAKKKKVSKKHDSPGVGKMLLIVAIAVMALGVTSVVQAKLQVDDTEVIDPPSELTVAGTINTEQQVFLERQEVTLTGDLDCSEGTALEGEVVNSYLVFYNNDSSTLLSNTKEWDFDEEVICVMYEHSGLKQVKTDGSLGAPNTSYSGIQDQGRGLELSGTSKDSISVNGTKINLTMEDEGFGDWIRVVTKYVAPPDDTAPVVYCEAITKNDKGNAPEKTFTLLGADEVDETVELFLTTETDEGETFEFGPYEDGTTIRHSVAKGATPTANSAGNKDIDYAIKTQGTMYITATDAAGNTAQEVCGG